MSTITKGIQSVFKPYLNVKNRYKGGKSIKPQREGDKVYKLSSNEHPFGTSPKVLEAIRKHTQDLHIYPDVNDSRLRDALVKDFNGQLEKDQFLAANSGSEIIDHTFRAFLKPGDEVIISTPCFVPYGTFSAWLGAKVIDVPLNGPLYQLDVDGILNAITDRTRIITVTSPNNPTGTYIPKDVFETLLNAVPDDVLIIYDEVYRHFADASDYTTAIPYVQAGKNVLAINSFSKTYGLASMRVGYGYTTTEIADYIRQVIKPFNIPTLAMEAAIAALEDKNFVEKTVQLIVRERQFLYQAFSSMGLDFVPSQANFFLMDPPIASAAFVEHLVANGIMTRPVDNFGAPGKVRISIGTREANEALVAALRKL